MPRRSLALLGTLVAAALAFATGAPAREETSDAVTVSVRNEAQFARAVKRLRHRGGTIVLRPRFYRRLVIGPRSGRWLRIVGRRGTRVERVLIAGARRVSFGKVVVRSRRGHAGIEVRASSGVVLHNLYVSARGTRFSSSILIPDSRWVTIRRSEFTHCGDRARDFVNCVTLYRWARHVRIEHNRFHDCFGCDFVHGRFGVDLVIRNNRFDRALPCRMGRHRCGHQDLVQLFAGWRLRVEGNHFGVYRMGGAQLYLTNDVDHATIVNNVFAATDPKVPSYRVRMGIVVGSNESRRLPYWAKIVNNTILSGARRKDGYAGSLRMSSRYGAVPRARRPIVANNVIALLETPARVCNGSQRFLNNVIIQGWSCSATDRIGPADLDERGRPLELSSVIDAANRLYAPPTDATGSRRCGAPDIGAFEFRCALER